MAFSFGQTNPSGNAPTFSTPSFGAGTPTPSSTPMFGQGNSTPAFGVASSSSLFGASSSPAFGASSTPAFGAASKPLFSPVSTPAFGASSSSLFGGSTTPAFGPSGPQGFSLGGASSGSSLFGQQGGATGNTGLFGPQSTQSFLERSTFAQQQQQPQGGTFPQLMTKDNRPIAHSTKWEDLSPQAQEHLLQLE